MPKKGDRARAIHAIGGPRPWRTVKRVCIPAVLLLFDHNHAGKSLRLRQKQCLEVATVSAVKCGTFQSFERSFHRLAENALHCKATATESLRLLHRINIVDIYGLQECKRDGRTALRCF